MASLLYFFCSTVTEAHYVYKRRRRTDTSTPFSIRRLAEDLQRYRRDREFQLYLSELDRLYRDKSTKNLEYNTWSVSEVQYIVALGVVSPLKSRVFVLRECHSLG